MKSEKLTHSEIISGLTYCFRELISTEVSHRNMPNIINRSKAAAAIVTAAHREEMMEFKRLQTQQIISGTKKKSIDSLKKAAEKDRQ